MSEFQKEERELLQSDHDLLVRLHERFGNFEKTVLSSIDSINNLVGKVMAQVDGKTEYREFISHKEKSMELFESNARRITALEQKELVDDTKKSVYVNIASWTWKHWLQVGAFITIMAGVLKAIILE